MKTPTKVGLPRSQLSTSRQLYGTHPKPTTGQVTDDRFEVFGKPENRLSGTLRFTRGGIRGSDRRDPTEGRSG